MPKFDQSKYALKGPEINMRVATLIRQLMDQHKISGNSLSECTGLTVQTISRARKGGHRFTRKNFEKIKDALCTNQFERAQLENFYQGKELFISDTPGLPNLEVDWETRLTAERHLTERAVDMHRRIAVREAIEKANLEYQQDYAVGPMHVDFLVRTQFEEFDPENGCKWPVPREFGIFIAGEDAPELFDAIARCLHEYLFLDQVIFVLPPKKEETRRGPKRKSPLRHCHSAVPIEQLKIDLMEIECDGCPPAITIEREAYEEIMKLPEIMANQLNALGIEISTKTVDDKKKYTCAKLSENKLIAIVPSKSYNLDIESHLEQARVTKKLLKCENVAVIIPDEWKLRETRLEDGFLILAVSALNKASLGVN